MAYGMMGPQFMAWIGSEFRSSNLRINALCSRMTLAL